MLGDVVVVCEGKVSFNKPILSLFTKHMRHYHRPQIHKWAPTTGYEVSNDGKCLIKPKTEGSGWELPVFSVEPLLDEITYIELAIREKGHILFFGVAKNNTVTEGSFLDKYQTICVYADDTSLGSDSVTVVSDCTVRSGDYMGMVVDKTKQEIKFYKNGKLTAHSTRTPCTMEPMYLVTWTYLPGATIEFCERYPFNSLAEY